MADPIPLLHASLDQGVLVLTVTSRQIEGEEVAASLKEELIGATVAHNARWVVLDLKKPGESVRLRFVLVEDVVRYPGGNGQRLHHHVVRGFPGGVRGFALEKEAGQQELTLSLADIVKTQKEYWEESNKKQPYPDDDRPLAFKDLKVVAFIQEEDTKAVHQAAQIDVPAAGKDEKKD